MQRKARDTWQEDVSPSALENDLLCDEGSLTDLSEVTHTVCACEQWIIVHDFSLGKHNPQQCGATFGFGHLPFNLTLTQSHTHIHSLSLVLVVMIQSKELKTEIFHTHSLIPSYSFSDSLSPTLSVPVLTLVSELGSSDRWLRPMIYCEVPILDGQDSLLCIYLHTLTITNSHTLPITCICCYDEIKGTQGQDFSCSFSDSLSHALTPLV